ncbi:MAG TPA: hypothetical protein VF030_06145 [Solirubrobacterales bacterium]
MTVVAPSGPRATSFVNPLAGRGAILVTAVGEAEGSRGAAAALACSCANVDEAALLIEVGGRVPRPTLIASAAAQQLEERLIGHLPQVRVAARGQVCHLAVPAEGEGLEAASAAVAVARKSIAVVHLPPELFQPVLAGDWRLRSSAALLRADLRTDRPLVALTVRDLIERRVATAVLKRRLSWVTERRALFGALPPGSPGGLSERMVRRLCEATR